MKSLTFSTKINRKTGKKQFTENFYIDEHRNHQRGKLPPVTHVYNQKDEKTGEILRTKEIKVCKFCSNALPETREKGHDRIFCDNDKCQKLHWKIKNLIEEKQKKEPDIIAIIREPIKIKKEDWDKSGKFYPPEYKIPERIEMKIVRKGKPKRENWEPLSTRKTKNGKTILNPNVPIKLIT